MNRRLFHLRPQLAAFIIAALLFTLAASAASAGWLSPNTNNNAQDNFGAPVYTSACANATIDNHLEIKNAWIANDGTNLYFKLEACGTFSNYQNIRYAGGLDCTGDGDINDGDTATLGDRKVVYTPPFGTNSGDQVNVVDGKNDLKFQMPNNTYGERVGATAIFEWYTTLQSIHPDCRSSATTIKMGLGTALISGTAQTKDTTPQLDWPMPIDYGDANNPNPGAQPPTCEQYPTRLACDGARHGTAGALHLGAAVDPDTGGLYGVDANGDDLANVADEDGVAPTAGVNWTRGGSGSLTANVTGGSGFLNCWVDWNRDNDWADIGEKVIDNLAVAAGANNLSISVPAGATAFPTNYIARCRVAPSSGQGAAITGAVEFGEVEDHKWAFGSTGNRPAPVTVTPAVVNATTLSLSWAAVTGNEGYVVLSSANPYFNPGDAGVTATADNAPPFDVANVVGGTPDTLFYALQGQVTTSDPDLTSALSNRVGLFEFGLVKGS